LTKSGTAKAYWSRSTFKNRTAPAVRRRCTVIATPMRTKRQQSV